MLHFLQRRHQDFLKGGPLKGSRGWGGGVHGHVSLRNFTAVGGRGLDAYSVKYGNKSLEDKNNSNVIILIGFFMKFKGDFLFLDVQKGGSFAPDDFLPRLPSLQNLKNKEHFPLSEINLLRSF